MSLKNMNTKDLLFTLWIFLTVNYLYCDVFTLHHAPELNLLLTGKVGDLIISQEFLLYFAFILEVPMLMIVLTRVLSVKWSKYCSLIAAIFTGTVQAWSLSMGGNTLHYIFFSIVEISTAVIIAGIAFRWKSVA